MNTETVINLKNKLVEDFQQLESKLNGESTSAFHQFRTNALEAFRNQSFPTRKHEEWKYNDLRPIIEKEYNNYSSSYLHEKLDLSQYLIQDVDAEILVFINGEWSEVNSKVSDSIEGLTISSFNNALKTNSEKVEQYFGKNSQLDKNIFSALNTAYAYDGVYVEVAKNTNIEKPIMLLFFNDSSIGNLIVHPRNLVIVGDNASVKVIEANYDLNDLAFTLNNEMTEIVAGQNAQVDYYKIQRENDLAYRVDITEIEQHRDSRVDINTFTFGGKMIRNELLFVHKGENIESYLNGLYLTDGKQLVDNRTMVDHAKPNCMSDEFYKGIMGGNSRGVFNGKILVRQEAQKTNAFQSNKNILVSDLATINTKPQLEIFADDVRCTHGATIGQLDDDALFYLQARGIGKELARKMLLKSFAAEVSERVKMEPITSYINELIETKLNKM